MQVLASDPQKKGTCIGNTNHQYDVGVRTKEHGTLSILYALENKSNTGLKINRAIVNLLLRAGADPNKEDNHGKKAIDFARENSNKEIPLLVPHWPRPPRSGNAQPIQEDYFGN